MYKALNDRLTNQEKSQYNQTNIISQRILPNSWIKGLATHDKIKQIYIKNANHEFKIDPSAFESSSEFDDSLSEWMTKAFPLAFFLDASFFKGFSSTLRATDFVFLLDRSVIEGLIQLRELQTFN
ncbi:hypothetical protein ACR2XN_28155 [Klebsiella pneumoniae]